jgi:hypothetical protein
VISGPGKRLSALLLVAFAAIVGAWALAPVAGARTVHYAGRAVKVPSGYEVVRVEPGSTTCTRLDRRAVYLGAPSKAQRCPAGPILGRHRAILITPGGERAAPRSLLRARPFGSAPRGIAEAGRARSLLRPRAAAGGVTKARARATASVSGSVFTGLGFDACSAPSTKAMAAWAESPFRGVGVYIGGENSACSQPNLSASWVSAQTTAGWHLIPTYVGLQAPTSACSSCAKLTPAGATSQGMAAAEDAVTAAGAIGIGQGSPIYFDMEAYSPTASATNAVLAFLEAWTEKLHALGYQSGVYSSSSSGIADLADAYADSGYTSPDNIWTANWNEREDTVDPSLPASAWPNHQRIHQFRGGHNETWGGQTINIDSDYVDGATVGVGTPPVGESDPIGSLELVSSPAAGLLQVKGWALDPDVPTEALSVNVVIGGREGQKGVEAFELGQVANLERTDVAASHKLAGPDHGFESTLTTIKSGPEPVCVYALNVALGGNRLLGCRTTNIPVAIAFTRLKAMPKGVKVTLACQWPTGTSCPGHLGLRTTFKVSTPRRHKPPRVHAVTRSLGSRTFHLSGGEWHTFYLPFTVGARKLLAERGKLATQVIAAIPGGKRGAGLPLVAPRSRR